LEKKIITFFIKNAYLSSFNLVKKKLIKTINKGLFGDGESRTQSDYASDNISLFLSMWLVCDRFPLPRSLFNLS